MMYEHALADPSALLPAIGMVVDWLQHDALRGGSQVLVGNSMTCFSVTGLTLDPGSATAAVHGRVIRAGAAADRGVRRTRLCSLDPSGPSGACRCSLPSASV